MIAVARARSAQGECEVFIRFGRRERRRYATKLNAWWSSTDHPLSVTAKPLVVVEKSCWSRLHFAVYQRSHADLALASAAGAAISNWSLAALPHPLGHAFILVSLRNSRTQHLRSEESTLGLLNHLLVDALWGVIHHHSASLVVNLRIDLCISNQINDPLLALRVGQAKSSGEVPWRSLAWADKPRAKNLLDVNPLVNLAVRLRYQVTS